MFVGEVTQVGTNVTSFKVGDIVYGTNGMKLGAYAEVVEPAALQQMLKAKAEQVVKQYV